MTTSSKSEHGHLQSSTEELRAMFAAIADTIMVFSREGVCLSIAPTAGINLITISKAGVGKNIRELFNAELGEVLLQAISHAGESRQQVEIDPIQIRGKRGRFFTSTLSPAEDDTFIWIARDITSQKYIEEMLIQRQQELVSLLNSLPTFAFVKDQHKRYVLVNDVFCQALRINRNDIIGKSDSELYSKEIAESYLKEDDRVISGEAPLIVTERQRLQDGRQVTVLTRKVPLKDTRGK